MKNEKFRKYLLDRFPEETSGIKRSYSMALRRAIEKFKITDYYQEVKYNNMTLYVSGGKAWDALNMWCSDNELAWLQALDDSVDYCRDYANFSIKVNLFSGIEIGYHTEVNGTEFNSLDLNTLLNWRAMRERTNK